MTEATSNVLLDALNDPEEPLTAEVEETAVAVAGCLKNVLKSSSGSSQAVGSTASKVNKRVVAEVSK